MTHTERKRAWQQHIADWQTSGLSGMAYCKRQSLTYCRFVYWRKKLAKPEVVPDRSAPSGFAKVAAIPGTQAAEGLTISLPGGISITGLHAGNVELLGDVLRQLLCTRATGGDVVILLISFWLASVTCSNRQWLLRGDRKPAVVLIITALVVTVVLEWLAIGPLERWTYADSMPIIPMLDVGLTPVFQWLLLSPVIMLSLIHI